MSSLAAPWGDPPWLSADRPPGVLGPLERCLWMPSEAAAHGSGARRPCLWFLLGLTLPCGLGGCRVSLGLEEMI